MHVIKLNISVLRWLIGAAAFFISLGVVVRTHAEVREVSASDVMSEFCATIATNEARYTEILTSCFPDSSQDFDARKNCRAATNSIVQVMNEFRRFRERGEIKRSYDVDRSQAPPSKLIERWNCKHYPTIPSWGCSDFTALEIEIASQEPICADAFEAEDRIGHLSENARRADQVLLLRDLRVVPAEPEPVVQPNWSL